MVQVVSMLRTTENKIYRQGIDDPKELADGFPTRAEDLFAYQALIIGSVEAGYFTPAQQELIREFVDRRGGGLLLLGGRFVAGRRRLGRHRSSPICSRWCCPTRSRHFHRDPATVEIDAGGRGQRHLPARGRSGGERASAGRSCPT